MEGDRKWSGKCSKMFVRVCDKSFVCVDFRACTLFACFFYCFFSLGFFRFINEQKEEVDERQRERERTWTKLKANQVVEAHWQHSCGQTSFEQTTKQASLNHSQTGHSGQNESKPTHKRAHNTNSGAKLWQRVRGLGWVEDFLCCPKQVDHWNWHTHNERVQCTLCTHFRMKTKRQEKRRKISMKWFHWNPFWVCSKWGNEERKWLGLIWMNDWN